MYIYNVYTAIFLFWQTLFPTPFSTSTPILRAYNQNIHSRSYHHYTTYKLFLDAYGDHKHAKRCMKSRACNLFLFRLFSCCRTLHAHVFKRRIDLSCLVSIYTFLISYLFFPFVSFFILFIDSYTHAYIGRHPCLIQTIVLSLSFS